MKHRARARRIRKRIEVPIYDAVVWLVVVDNVAKERRKWEHLFGPAPAANYNALCSRSGGQDFALFFSWEAVTFKTIAHEVFHLTHRILEWVNANFDATHHEQGALLHGHLMECVCAAIKFREAGKTRT
jgi:hypothetical protein